MNSVFEEIASGRVKRTKMQRMIDKESREFGYSFIKVKEHGNMKCFRNRDFLVQVFDEVEVTRISVNRIKIDKSGTKWKDGITWDELQEIKHRLGYGGRCAVEIYPPDKNVVNVANIRHLFILKECPNYMWGSSNKFNHLEQR